MRKLFVTSVALLFLAAIFVGAIMPNPLITKGTNDKVLHFTEFFVFTVVVWLAVRVYVPKNQFIISLVISSLVGVLSELVQLFTVVRTASIIDYFADMAGALFAIALLWLGRILKKSRLPR